MKLRVLKAKQWLLIALLGLMGFTACSKDDDDGGEIHLMYGPPEAFYNPNK